MSGTFLEDWCQRFREENIDLQNYYYMAELIIDPPFNIANLAFFLKNNL